MSDCLKRNENRWQRCLSIFKKSILGALQVIWILMFLPLAMLVCVPLMSGLLFVVASVAIFYVPDWAIKFLLVVPLVISLSMLIQSIEDECESVCGAIFIGLLFAIIAHYIVVNLTDLRNWLDHSDYAVYTADGKEFLGCTQAKGYQDFEVKKALTPWNCKLVPAPSVADYVEVNWTDQVGKPWEVFVMKYCFKTKTDYIKVVEEVGGSNDDTFKAKVHEVMERAVLQAVGDLTEVPRDEAKVKELAAAVKVKMLEAFPELDIVVGVCEPMRLDPQLEKRLQPIMQ